MRNTSAIRNGRPNWNTMRTSKIAKQRNAKEANKIVAANLDVFRPRYVSFFSFCYCRRCRRRAWNRGPRKIVFVSLIDICNLHPRRWNRLEFSMLRGTDVYELLTSELILVFHFDFIPTTAEALIAHHSPVGRKALTLFLCVLAETQVQRLRRLLFFRILVNGYRSCIRNVGIASRENVPTPNEKKAKYFECTVHTLHSNILRQLLDDSICGMPRMRELCE